MLYSCVCQIRLFAKLSFLDGQFIDTKVAVNHLHQMVYDPQLPEAWHSCTIIILETYDLRPNKYFITVSKMITSVPTHLKSMSHGHACALDATVNEAMKWLFLTESSWMRLFLCSIHIIIYFVSFPSLFEFNVDNISSIPSLYKLDTPSHITSHKSQFRSQRGRLCLPFQNQFLPIQT